MAPTLNTPSSPSPTLTKPALATIIVLAVLLFLALIALAVLVVRWGVVDTFRWGTRTRTREGGPRPGRSESMSKRGVGRTGVGQGLRILTGSNTTSASTPELEERERGRNPSLIGADPFAPPPPSTTPVPFSPPSSPTTPTSLFPLRPPPTVSTSTSPPPRPRPGTPPTPTPSRGPSSYPFPIRADAGATAEDDLHSDRLSLSPSSLALGGRPMSVLGFDAWGVGGAEREGGYEMGTSVAPTAWEGSGEGERKGGRRVST